MLSCAPPLSACTLWATAGCVAFNRKASLKACEACSGAFQVVAGGNVPVQVGMFLLPHMVSYGFIMFHKS